MSLIHTHLDAVSQVGIYKGKHVLLFSEILFETQFIPVFTKFGKAAPWGVP
jgi:hypothetical protein